MWRRGIEAESGEDFTAWAFGEMADVDRPRKGYAIGAIHAAAETENTTRIAALSSSGRGRPCRNQRHVPSAAGELRVGPLNRRGISR